MAQLTGKVTDGAGAGLPGAKVQISWYKWTRTGMLGFYNLGSVGTGRKTLVFTKKGYRRLEMAVTIVAGNNPAINVTMVLLLGNLTGRVTDSVSGAGISDVSVTLGPGTPYMTDANGNYAISGITPGSYPLTFAKAGYQTVTK